MLPRVHSLGRLPSSEQRLALQALGTLVLIRLALRLLPFRKLRKVVDRWAAAPAVAPDAGFARGVRRAVDRAARTIPGSACLPQAITAELMLRRAGQPARVSIGVAPDGHPLDAHAWVESAGIMVTGDSRDLHKYRTLVVFGSDAQGSDSAEETASS